MKTCVFITGTNSAGKTTLAKALIERFGGIRETTKDLTFCNDSRVCFAGRYKDENRFGGVDVFNCTRVLSDVVEKGLESCDIVICEGMYLHTFGLNLTNAMFKAQKHLVVFLYAGGVILHSRLLQRGKKGLSEQTLPKQKNACQAAKKWAEIGVPVLCYNTGECELETEVEEIYDKILSLWNGKNTMKK